MNQIESVIIYTDGACIGNPGPGGYAAILFYNDKRKEVSGGYNKTTNNRMEMMAAIKGLENLKKECQVTLYSDSQYLVNSITKGWVRRWQANGWKRNKKEYALNVDLWKQLLALCKTHNVDFKWTRGHVGTPDNERCDFLANEAAKQKNLPDDPINNSNTKLDLF